MGGIGNSQRAFRARKAGHVKDLERKLSDIESSATTLASDNQRLKLALQRLMTENELLRSTSAAGRPRPQRMGKRPPSIATAGGAAAAAASPRREDGADGPDEEAVPVGRSPRPRGVEGDKAASEYILSMGEAWDFLIEHPLVKEGLVDITDASNRLRRAAKAGPHGPVFRKGEAQAAVEGSKRSGGDVLA
jgi:hypothetical protein